MHSLLISILIFFALSWPSFSAGSPADAGDTAGTDQTNASNNRAEGSSLLADPGEPPFAIEREFSTDFSRSTIHFADILSGGPSKDGIPSIDKPSFVSVMDADGWLDENEPVLFLRYQGKRKAYPLQILMWHEIVNDTLDDIPVAVTYCPLCNTGIAFRGEIDGMPMQFGTTGRLRFSNLIMYDRQTESWWQQASGEGIVGEYAGRQLTFLPVSILPWDQVRSAYPDAEVLSRDTGYTRPYGRNPYEGYDSSSTPFLYHGPEIGNRQNPMERVLAVWEGDSEKIFTYTELQEEKVLHETIGSRRIVLFWEAGTASALDEAEIDGGRDVGTAQAFYPSAAGTDLEFYSDGTVIRDRTTDSIWTVGGKAVSGELKGTQLVSPVTINHFWFSWNAFRK